MSFFSDDTNAGETRDIQDACDLDAVSMDECIDADVQSVWEALSQPGWWINEQTLGDALEVTWDVNDGLFHVEDSESGTWLIEKVDDDPMDLVAYRWYPLASDEYPEEHTTRVEFSLSDEDGQVNVHLEESDFLTVSDDEDTCTQAYEDSQGMWPGILRSLKEHLERP